MGVAVKYIYIWGMARLFILFGAVAIQQWGISGLKFSFLGELERGVEWGDY